MYRLADAKNLWRLRNDDSIIIIIPRLDLDDELQQTLIKYFENVKTGDNVDVELAKILPDPKTYDSTTDIEEFNKWYTLMVKIKLMAMEE